MGSGGEGLDRGDRGCFGLAHTFDRHCGRRRCLLFSPPAALPVPRVARAAVASLRDWVRARFLRDHPGGLAVPTRPLYLGCPALARTDVVSRSGRALATLAARADSRRVTLRPGRRRLSPL